MDENNGLLELKKKYEDGFITVHGRKYVLTKMKFTLRSDILSYYTEIAETVQTGNLKFLRTNEFKKEIQPIICDHVLFEPKNENFVMTLLTMVGIVYLLLLASVCS